MFWVLHKPENNAFLTLWLKQHCKLMKLKLLFIVSMNFSTSLLFLRIVLFVGIIIFGMK